MGTFSGNVLSVRFRSYAVYSMFAATKIILLSGRSGAAKPSDLYQ